MMQAVLITWFCYQTDTRGTASESALLAITRQVVQLAHNYVPWTAFVLEELHLRIILLQGGGEGRLRKTSNGKIRYWLCRMFGFYYQRGLVEVIRKRVRRLTSAELAVFEPLIRTGTRQFNRLGVLASAVNLVLVLLHLNASLLMTVKLTPPLWSSG
jgi:hypothetical protein